MDSSTREGGSLSRTNRALLVTHENGRSTHQKIVLLTSEQLVLAISTGDGEFIEKLYLKANR